MTEAYALACRARLIPLQHTSWHIAHCAEALKRDMTWVHITTHASLPHTLSIARRDRFFYIYSATEMGVGNL